MKTRRRKPGPTVAEIARQAEVSVGTVSRVLNGHTNVMPQTLARVRQTITSLGYQKHSSTQPAAFNRARARGRTGNIAIIYAEMGEAWAGHPFVGTYFAGVQTACRERGYHAMMEFSEDGLEVPSCVREGKVDGILIKTIRSFPDFVRHLPPSCPYVGVAYSNPASSFECVAADNHGAGWIMADYLWGLGHRRIAFICHERSQPFFFARYQGCEAFLRSKQAFDPALCWLDEPEDDPQRRGRSPIHNAPILDDALAQILTAPGEKVTALIAANDWAARSVYQALNRRGVRVPEEISVVGLDNAPPELAEGLQPPLTTFDIDFTALAYAATVRLLEKIQNPATKHAGRSIHLIRGRLVERASARLLPGGYGEVA